MKLNSTIAILLLAGIVLLGGCDDFALKNIDNSGTIYDPDKKPGGGDDDDDDKGKYADMDLSGKISEEELAQLTATEASISDMFFNFTYEGLYNDYQRTTSLSHDIYSGYMASNNPNFNSSAPSYVYTDGWSALRWDHFYKERCKEYGTLIRTFHYVNKEKYRNAFYITRIYFAFLLSNMTDTYGDMPCKPYLKGLTVADKLSFDSQKDVFDVMFRMLEQATDSIKVGESEFKFDAKDHCYRGDEAKWLRFANTLRLRLALRISNSDPERAKAEGEAAMAHEAGLMKAHDDNMSTIPKYAPVALGGIGDTGNENIQALCSFAYLDVVMSKDLELAFKGQSSVLDPRCSVTFWKPSSYDDLKAGRESKTPHTGCEIGDINVTRSSEKYSTLRCHLLKDKELTPTHWFGYSRESVWMSYAETQFLLAEAALRGWAGASDSPYNYFRKGIMESMSYYMITTAKAEEYFNKLQIFANGENPFMGTDREAILESIITQKWLAVFPNGNEAWAEFRRTDYPRLLNHKNNMSSDVPLNKFIKRVRYPNSELEYNAENVPANFKQGDRLWWDVSDTNDGSGQRLTPNNFR